MSDEPKLTMKSAEFNFKEGSIQWVVRFSVESTKTVILVNRYGITVVPKKKYFYYKARTTGFTKKGKAKVVHGRANPNQTNARYWIKKYKEQESWN